MKKFGLFLLCICLFAPHVFSQEQNNLRAKTEAMFNSFKPGEIETAIDTFAKDSLIPNQLVDQVKSQARASFKAENPILGFEFLQEQRIGKSIWQFTYLLKTKEQPYLWTFSFYKPDSTWVPLRVSFEDAF